jgi:hypothetical protein
LTALAVIGIVSWLALKGAVWVISPFVNDHWAVCTVTDKDRVSTASSGRSDSRIYTEECGVLVNKDMWVRGKTRSADVYSQVRRGKRYSMHVVGIRLGVVSAFPNVLEVKPVRSKREAA